jgi:DNA-binding response OmpR family regulator
VTADGPQILVVDDVASLRAMVATYLEGEGYRVTTAADGRQALAAARATPPDLVILDVMMPQMDGYQFLQAFRRENDAPVIMLTAKLEETDKVLALELGADDYLTKPFGMRELSARLKAVLRRVEPQARQGELLEVGEMKLDRRGRRLAVGDRQVDLTPTELGILATLMSAPGRAFSRLELLARLQGNIHEANERTIDVHVRNLRAKIEPDPRQPRIVQTVYGVGYRLAPGQ